MEDALILFDTAKLAKEKGFNIERNKSWRVINSKIDSVKRNSIGPTYPHNNATPIGVNIFETYYAPTQTILQRWLREVKNFDVSVIYWDKGYLYAVEQRPHKGNHYAIDYIDTYEEALEKGLQEALKLI